MKDKVACHIKQGVNSMYYFLSLKEESGMRANLQDVIQQFVSPTAPPALQIPFKWTDRTTIKYYVILFAALLHSIAYLNEYIYPVSLSLAY